MYYKRLQVSNLISFEDLKFLYPSLPVSEVIEFEKIHKRATKDTAKFADLIDQAIQKNFKISIVYAAKEDNFVEEKRIITPLAFQVKKPKHENQEYTYVTAYNNFSEIRSYRFDRLKEVKTVSLPGKYPKDGYSTYYDFYADDIQPDFYNENDDILDYAKDLI